MGSYTDNLGLYKVNTETDGNDTFNINTMMNDNWDIIDAFSKGLRMKTYTNLSQIGLTAGSETIESILTAMPVNSILYVEVGASNADIYPTHYGTFIARKLSTSRWFAEFYPKETTDLYVCSAKIENSTFAFYDWEKKADYNDIEDLKKSVSDGKTLVANAITAKGITTATDATFQTMADNVASIITLDSVPHTTPDGTLDGYSYINTEEVKIILNSTKTDITLSNSVYVTDMCYDGNKIVAVCKRGIILVSSDNGVTWTESSVIEDLSESTDLCKIVYENGKYIVLKYGSNKTSYVFYSTDCITWNKATDTIINDGKDICFGGGVFVMVRSADTGYSEVYSSDGITWNIPDVYTSGSYWNVFYGNGSFIATRRNGRYTAISSDGGKTWETGTILPNSNTSTDLEYGAFGNGIFVAGNTSGIRYSTDGKTWSDHISLSKKDYADYTDIYFDEKFGLFIVLSRTRLAYSADAINWSYHDLTLSTISSYESGSLVKYNTGIIATVASSLSYVVDIKLEKINLVKIPSETYLDGVDYVKYTP